ncbi:MAG: dTDP-4-dehydrorhamnose 3,5-epimerase [Bacteroides sp.]|nr:dTDP-4-dehydrorhamnose 3,5-epimerase [Bacteroides sp.]
MNYIQTEIPGAWIIQPEVYADERGYFFESFRKEEFEANIGKVGFIQENESKSGYGTLRGLHYQSGAYSQAKLVRVIEGTVWDVIVDLRRSSPTFGKHICVELSGENKRQLFVPRGMAHGFLVTSEHAIFAYKVDNVYAPHSEKTLLYSDKKLAIDWQIKESQLILSKKDKEGILFDEADYFE